MKKKGKKGSDQKGSKKSGNKKLSKEQKAAKAAKEKKEKEEEKKFEPCAECKGCALLGKLVFKQDIEEGGCPGQEDEACALVVPKTNTAKVALAEKMLSLSMDEKDFVLDLLGQAIEVDGEMKGRKYNKGAIVTFKDEKTGKKITAAVVQRYKREVQMTIISVEDGASPEFELGTLFKIAPDRLELLTPGKERVEPEPEDEDEDGGGDDDEDDDDDEDEDEDEDE